ncbi:DNA-3-methyladenine glycosylase I [Planobacterium oryzisoli]|uniref:DNA-3-methyladenine glycosylase I n=1 Tax=Planobacterium oryzisoli TaxID=2771435 RepID=A0A930YUA8_9FLAO|nr:DNA-3-methyladenine glycosylase I [Planobacterium oryzisoli]MBF5026477.1 DNA-3-methyladenine glycosylase I [Planobacterium oryzisoli]
MQDAIKRCPWSEKDQLYRDYHDNEWGRPVYDDMVLFEFLILESFQAGLSWHTILKKRENFREAFDDFSYERIAHYQEDKIQKLMLNAGIIRNQLKIRAAVTNAQRFLEVREQYGTFCDYIWNFVGGQPIVNAPKTLSEIPATTELSDLLAADLKKKGFKFMGSTVVYAHMQATGMVWDHLVDCHCSASIEV